LSARDAVLPLDELVEEAQRVLSICNACRYCEGFCAVFPALERRLEFTEHDVHYLANLCHNCGACLYACQYAPPHEFNLDFPKVLSQVRGQTYRKYAWPEGFARLYERNGLVVSLVLALSIFAAFFFSGWYAGGVRFFSSWSDADGSFYALIPHSIMAGVFGAVFLFVIMALTASFARFWPDMGEETIEFIKAPPLSAALSDAASLRYLDGGGDGCTYPDERPSFARRNFHHLTFWGFVLCFLATVTATIYHYVFNIRAPYPFYSLPVILGTLGGIGLVVGPIGLIALRTRRDPALGDATQAGMDRGFLVLLLGTAITGLGLLLMRESILMGTWLALHLGFVLAFFLTMPYGKFVHGLYRLAALVRFHIERRRPLPDFAAE
jgi:citrate/tricarballylate utilization protein